MLFFDEADSLFGPRVEANTSNDRALNQEVGYLLQRMEDHPGLMILATNLRGALDPAFARPFQGVAPAGRSSTFSTSPASRPQAGPSRWSCRATSFRASCARCTTGGRLVVEPTDKHIA